MQHSDSFDEEKREANYLALQSPSAANPAPRPSAVLMSNDTITSSTLDLHSVEEKRQEDAAFTKTKADPLASPTAQHAHHISVAPTQKSSTIEAATIPAPPCPGQRAMWSWRFPTLLYYGWLTPLMLLGAKRPLQFADVPQTFDSDKAESIWAEFEPAWAAQEAKSKVQGRKPKLVNTFTRVYGLEMLWCCLAYGWVNADALLGPQFLQKLVEYSQERDSVSSWQGYKWYEAQSPTQTRIHTHMHVRRVSSSSTGTTCRSRSGCRSTSRRSPSPPAGRRAAAISTCSFSAISRASSRM